MIMLLFSDFFVNMQNNGYHSKLFRKTRGVNQGCPASPGIFTQTCAIMEHLIAEKKDIKGISMYGIEHILSQFADDTSAFMSFDPLTINGFCDVLQQLEDELGLKVSYDKTSLYRVGSLKNSDARCYTQQPLRWTNENITTLGVTFDQEDNACHTNIDKIMVKIKNVCDNWQNRNASISGKILLINALIGSLFVYHMSVMLNMSEAEIKNIEKCIYSFLWNGKSRGRIAIATLQNPKKHGGLNLVNISAKQDALKIQNVFRSEQSLLECMYNILNITELRDLIWKCNINYKDATTLWTTKSYWSESLAAWSKINFANPKCRGDILNQILWLNSWIQVQGTPIIWNKWIRKGIFSISDIVQENGEFIGADRLPDGLNWLDYVSLKNAIPSSWKELLKGNVMGDCQPQLYTEIVGLAKISKALYTKLVTDKSLWEKYANRWKMNELTDLDQELYQKSFSTIDLITKNTKLRDFQYRTLLKKLVFQSDLYNWGKVESPNCKFCDLAVENFCHLFLECTHTTPIWQAINELFIQNGENRLNLSLQAMLLNEFAPSTKHIANYIGLIVKQYIYRCRCLDILPIKWKEEIDKIERYEFYSSKLHCKTAHHISKWGKYKPELHRLNIIEQATAQQQISETLY